MKTVKTVTVRSANLSDKPKLKEFQKSMALETEGLNLDEEVVDKGLDAILTDPAKGKYFVAENGNEVIGCLMVTPEWSDWRKGTVWWIQSVYVVKSFRRMGIYRKLYEHIKSWVLSQEDYRGIRLYVEKDNTIAQEVYKAMGMDGEHYKLFEWMKP